MEGHTQAKSSLPVLARGDFRISSRFAICQVSKQICTDGSLPKRAERDAAEISQVLDRYLDNAAFGWLGLPRYRPCCPLLVSWLTRALLGISCCHKCLVATSFTTHACVLSSSNIFCSAVPITHGRSHQQSRQHEREHANKLAPRPSVTSRPRQCHAGVMRGHMRNMLSLPTVSPRDSISNGMNGLLRSATSWISSHWPSTCKLEPTAVRMMPQHPGAGLTPAPSWRRLFW